MTWYEWLCVFSVPSIMFFMFQFLWTKVVAKYSKKTSEDETLKLGVQALLRNELMHSYKLFIAQGWIDIYEKQNFDNMYQRYHNLGKNGVMNSMHDEIMALPTTPNKPR